MSTSCTHVDVAILGGGIAGLTLALQLTRARPGLRITVVEKATHPVPEAVHKVGESSVEIQAHYLRDVLGLERHLTEDQLHKFGLRMFFSHGDNDDIARRVEYGQVAPAPLPSYQLDRGRLENELGSLVLTQGVQFLDGHRVSSVELSDTDAPHRIELSSPQGDRTLTTRWVVDASGRAGLLKRKLDLHKQLDHHANAAWLRIEHEIDIDNWSDDAGWRARVTDGQRRLSTNHLMGDGYWVWLIPLASGCTSVGIVAEHSKHAFDGFNRLERALQWLHEHEPQCAAEIEAHRDRIQDFRVMRNYAYGCTQVYSSQRWCLTGEAGVSIDPLYSSGGDLMAISNGLITDLICRDAEGQDIEDTAAAHSQVYLVLAEIWLVAYQDQYPVMANPQVMVAKVIWDTIIYWAVPGLLAFHDTFRNLSQRPGVFQGLFRTWTLHTRVQQFFREWHALDNPEAEDTFADPYSLLDFIVDLHNGMAAGLAPDELEAQFDTNVRLLEQVAGQLIGTVIARLESRGAEPAVAQQLVEWREDPLLIALLEFSRRQAEINPIDDAWVTLGHRVPAVKEPV